MPLKVTRPLSSVSDLHGQAAARTARLLKSIHSSGDAHLDVESLRRTQAEVDAGIMMGPWPSDHLPSWLRVVSRCPIWENHGSAGTRKCCNFYDMSDSNVNSTVEDYESYAPKGIEHIMALVGLLRGMFGDNIDLLGWTADFKQSCISPSRLHSS